MSALRAGGSTLVYPIMQKWIAEYRQPKGVEVDGRIGYAQLNYGLQNEVQSGLVQNAAGDFVAPQPAAITVAAAEVH